MVALGPTLSNVRILDLSGNPIGAEWATALAPGMLQRLEELNLKGRGIPRNI